MSPLATRFMPNTRIWFSAWLVYTINTHGQSIYISEFGKMTTGALRDSIHNGFAQRDEVNAKLQLQAMAKVLGRELIGDCLVVRLGDDKPKKRNTAKKTDTPVPAAANDASVLVEKKTFDEPEVWKTSAQETHEILKETREKAEALMTSKPVSDDAIETDAVKLVEKFTAEINAAETVDAVMQIRYKINPNTYMVRGQIIE